MGRRFFCYKGVIMIIKLILFALTFSIVLLNAINLLAILLRTNILWGDTVFLKPTFYPYFYLSLLYQVIFWTKRLGLF